jgi:single-strand DNA-binding protein
LFGNLGADPELRFTGGGMPILNFRLATTSSYFDKDKDQRIERTDWHTCVIFGKRGEALSKILTKGSTVLVVGQIRNSSYDDKKTGEKRYKTEIAVDQICLAGGRGQQRHAEDPADNYDRTDGPASGAEDFDTGGAEPFAPAGPPPPKPRTGGGGYGPPAGRGVAR